MKFVWRFRNFLDHFDYLGDNDINSQQRISYPTKKRLAIPSSPVSINIIDILKV